VELDAEMERVWSGGCPHGSSGDVSADEHLQTVAVEEADGVVIGVAVGIDAPGEPDGIGLDVPSGVRIVIPEVVVVQPGVGIYALVLGKNATSSEAVIALQIAAMARMTKTLAIGAMASHPGIAVSKDAINF